MGTYSRNVEILWFVRVQCRGENYKDMRTFVNGESGQIGIGDNTGK